jgi:hypothetical protein
MSLNKQEQALKTVMDKLKQILGASMVLETVGAHFKDKIQNDRMIGHDLIVGSLSFRNITSNKDEPNLYLTDSYLLDRSNLDEEIEMLLSRECLFHIAQAYEFAETFLYDIIADLILLKGGLQIFIDNKTMNSDFESIRKALKSLNDRQNNKHLIGLMRANCEAFALYEKNNIYDVDFSLWYQTWGEVRHCVTHSGMVVNSNLKRSLPIHFQGYIDIIKHMDVEYLYMDGAMCRNLLSRIADFIFFCFKSVSEASYGNKIDFQSIDYLLKGVYSQS